MRADQIKRERRISGAPPLLVVDIARVVAWLISKPLWFITFEGIDNIPRPDTGPLILAANHQTYIDPAWVCIPVRRRFRYMAFSEAFDWPIIGALIRHLGAFPVQHPIDTNPAAIKESLRALKDGLTLVIFPEGARAFPSGELLPFKSGVVKIAMRTGVPILPVTVSGANKVWPSGRKWPRLFRKVRITYHQPICPTDAKSAEEWTAELATVIGDKALGLVPVSHRPS